MSFYYRSFEGDRSLIYPGTSSGRYEVQAGSEGRSTLVLKNAQVQDSGTVIICSAVNAAGSASTRTRLTVTSKEDRPPPVIIRGPVNQTLPIHSVAILTCEAVGKLTVLPFIVLVKVNVRNYTLGMSVHSKQFWTGNTLNKVL